MQRNRGKQQKIRFLISLRKLDTKGTFHAKIGSIKDRNGMDLSEVEDIKKRWQEYTEELYKNIFLTQIITICDHSHSPRARHPGM